MNNTPIAPIASLSTFHLCLFSLDCNFDQSCSTRLLRCSSAGTYAAARVEACTASSSATIPDWRAVSVPLIVDR